MPITRQEIDETVRRYLAALPEDTERLRPLLTALEAGLPLVSRREFRAGGHLTCGAVVVDDQRRLLMVHHRILRRWLLPGGHVEKSDRSLRDAALRELHEETGIPPSATEPLGGRYEPIDIDIHAIPGNEELQERPHWHADVLFAFAVGTPHLRLQTSEVVDHAWRSPWEAPSATLSHRIVALLYQNA